MKMYNYCNNVTKHKVFVSYYHNDDQVYKNYIDDNFKDKIINKSVMNNDINSDNGDEYIKRLIREDYISDSSVVVVLVGKNTKTRKYNISTFIKKSFLYEYSKKRKKNESLYKFKKRFLLEMEELLITSPAITIQAKEKISYILKNFFFANISSN